MDENQSMQREYDLYFGKKHERKTIKYSVNQIPENKIVIKGNKIGRMMCRIKSVYT